MSDRLRAHHFHAKDTASLLELLIHINRKKYRWSEASLAECMGISRTTLRKLEKGDLRCSLELYFVAASLTGIKLFELNCIPAYLRDAYPNIRPALLPEYARFKGDMDLDDDF
jgi:DNA-binding XRE family transcriptional regulator